MIHFLYLTFLKNSYFKHFFLKLIYIFKKILYTFSVQLKNNVILWRVDTKKVKLLYNLKLILNIVMFLKNLYFNLKVATFFFPWLKHLLKKSFILLVYNLKIILKIVMFFTWLMFLKILGLSFDRIKIFLHDLNIFFIL